MRFTMASILRAGILEFIVQRPDSTSSAEDVVKAPDLPNENRRLHKYFLLRSLQNKIAENSISEEILDTLDMIWEIDRSEGTIVADSMKKAYCSVALDCTVKVCEKIWDRKSGYLEKSKMRELLTENFGQSKVDVEPLIWDPTKTREQAWTAVKEYLDEALASLGASFLAMVAKNEKLALEPMRREGSKQKSHTHRPQQKSIHHFKRYKGPIRLIDSEETDVEAAHFSVSSSEGNKVREADKLSSQEQEAVIALPEASCMTKAEACKMTAENSDNEPIACSCGEQDKDICAQYATPTNEVHFSVSSSKGNRVREADKLNSQELKEAVIALPEASCMTKAEASKMTAKNSDNEPIAGGSGQQDKDICAQYAAPSAAHTSECDDSMDRSKGRLPLPKKTLVSPLKKDEPRKPAAARRKRRFWTIHEEDTLREGVKMHGVGNWKLILKSNAGAFEDRTEVDLKDKWRNMRGH